MSQKVVCRKSLISLIFGDPPAAVNSWNPPRPHFVPVFNIMLRIYYHIYLLSKRTKKMISWLFILSIICEQLESSSSSFCPIFKKSYTHERNISSSTNNTQGSQKFVISQNIKRYTKIYTTDNHWTSSTGSQARHSVNHVHQDMIIEEATLDLRPWT